MLWIKLSFRQIRNHLRFSLFFVLNLSLGLVGFITLDSFKLSLNQHLAKNAKAILTADLSIAASRQFQEQELELVSEVLGGVEGESRQVSFFSMVASREQSRLVRIVAIDRHFPLYGEIILQEPTESLGIWEEPRLLAYPELLSSLGVKEGDSLKVGEQSFIIGSPLVQDPGSLASAFGLAPKVYIGYPYIEATGLLRQGSRIHHQHFYKLPLTADVNALTSELEQGLEALLGSNPDIRIQTPERSSAQLGRALGYMNDYLGLVSLIALFLAGIGAAYLFRSFLAERFKEIAIMLSLGATRQQAYQLLLMQVAFLGLVSATIACVLTISLFPLLPILLKDFIPVGFEGQLSGGSIILSLLMGTIGSMMVCFPLLFRIRSIQASALFHENVAASSFSQKTSYWQYLSYMPAIIIYWLLAVWQSNSWVVGSLFTGLFLGALVILGMVAWGVIWMSGRFSTHSNVTWKLALRSLYRERLASTSSFLAIAVGALLMNLIPQIQKGLEQEMSQPGNLQRPDFFLFDIQEEQVQPLKDYFKQSDFHLHHLSPMVRAQLELVNGQPFEVMEFEDANTREEQSAQRFQNRTYNLSYRTALADSESIVEGPPMTTEYDFESEATAEISLEQRFAERLGFEIGDVLTFDVQGIEVSGKVVNLRRVQWNSFQPNFFVLFQPGVLEMAPKTFLASVAGVPQSQRLQWQNEMVTLFPNISLIDVSRVVEQLMVISDQMRVAIQFMAYLCLLSGLVVIFSIARYQVQQRSWEMNLLKVLGSSFRDIRRMVQIEFGILSLFAATFGALLSIGISYAISLIFFESIWTLSWTSSFLTIGGVSVLSILVAMLAVQRILHQKPLALLKAV